MMQISVQELETACFRASLEVQDSEKVGKTVSQKVRTHPFDNS